MDYTNPNTQFTFDVNNSLLFKRDAQNFINVLGVQQLNTLENISLLDIFMSADQKRKQTALDEAEPPK